LTSSDVVACGPWRPNENRPPTRAGDNSHKSETRISAIVDFARKGKREKKALPLSLGAQLAAAVAGPLEPSPYRAGGRSASAQVTRHHAACGLRDGALSRRKRGCL
jgi:hypothetical protein